MRIRSLVDRRCKEANRTVTVFHDVFGCLINSYILSGMDASFLNRTRISPELFILPENPTSFCGQPWVSQQFKKNIWLTCRIWLIGQRTRENYRVHHCFSKTAHWFNISLMQPSVITATWLLPNIPSSLVSNFKFPSILPALFLQQWKKSRKHSCL